MNLRDEVKYEPLTGHFYYLKPSHGRKIGSPIGSVNSNGYRQICVGSKRYQSSRLAWFLVHGSWPDFHIDHINRDKLDDRLSNLREATPSENQCNRRSKGYSYHKGSGKYQARIQVDGKTTYLGWYDTEEEARESFENAQEQYHGEFACKIKD